MKLAIMSDSHDRWDHLEKAIKMAHEHGCELLLFAGDVIAPTGIGVLEKFNGKVTFVWGNNEGERVAMTRKMDASEKIELCGDVYEGTIDGIKIFMNHYPRFTELAAKSGEFDLCIYGHTHHYHHEMVGVCLLLNPGEIQGYGTGVSSFVIFDTKTKKAEKVVVS
ncbi:metallophosphoesterase [Candidatus Woesebacteria bacterium]|nr:metallophosphoesterase [Candidatus Woesebacteria bacterium]